MSDSFSAISDLVFLLSGQLRKAVSETSYNPPPGSVSVEAILDRLLPSRRSDLGFPDESGVRVSVMNFALACALLSSSRSADHDLLSWTPATLSATAESVLQDLSEAYCTAFRRENARRIGTLGLDCGTVPEEKRLVVELMPDVAPLLKADINASSVDVSDKADEFAAASARMPVEYAIAAAYQLRWFITQIVDPHLGKLCSLVIPLALTALDHWCPEVKGQGMVSLIHISKNVNAAELRWFGDAILDACHQNIASSDQIWHLVVEMSVLFLTLTQQRNPRSPWSEMILTEMLSHLERQPGNKDRRVAWLQHIEAFFNSLGLLLLAHFRRIFPLFFQWIRADDDETILLTLKQIDTVVRLTWIRNTPYLVRLVNELVVLYKKAPSRKSCEDIRKLVSQILIVLSRCKGSQFNEAFEKHRDDLDLDNLLYMSA